MSQAGAEYRQGTMNGRLFKIQTSGLKELIWRRFITYDGEGKRTSTVGSKNRRAKPPRPQPDASEPKRQHGSAVILGWPPARDLHTDTHPASHVITSVNKTLSG